MPAVWLVLRKSLHCKSKASDVHDPSVNNGNILIKRTNRSGCSKSIANLKDVIHGSKRHTETLPICSPRSFGSSELLNPITHEVVLSNSTCELKITGFRANGCTSCEDGVSTFVGTLKPGTPGPGSQLHLLPPHNNRESTTFMSKDPHSLNKKGGSGFGGISSKPRASFGTDSHGLSALTCHKCGEKFVKWEAVEAHHLSKHAVTELVEGDSSRKIVELIYRTSWSKSNNNCGGIERILKVHNMQKTLAQFEEHRETVKIKASKLPKKHARCLADGNELLRFYGTTVECSLGINSSSSLCTSDRCNVCRILRHGFLVSIKKQVKGGVGVFTTSTSGRAFESIQPFDDKSSMRKALIVCRVIAGRVRKPLENIQEMSGQLGFDSLAGKVGLYSNIEELYLLNPRALLPCFVIICKP